MRTAEDEFRGGKSSFNLLYVCSFIIVFVAPVSIIIATGLPAISNSIFTALSVFPTWYKLYSLSEPSPEVTRCASGLKSLLPVRSLPAFCCRSVTYKFSLIINFLASALLFKCNKTQAIFSSVLQFNTIAIVQVLNDLKTIKLSTFEFFNDTRISCKNSGNPRYPNLTFNHVFLFELFYYIF